MTSQQPPHRPGDSGGATDDADHYTIWDAAYVLGALTPDERREYEGHLSRCGPCRTAVTEICGIPALLRRLDTATAVGALNGGDEKPISARNSRATREVLTAVNRVRCRRRLGWAAIIMVTAVTVSIPMIAVREYRGASSMPVTVPMRQVTPNALTSWVALTVQQWGTRVDVRTTLTDTPHESEHHDDEAGDIVAVMLINNQGDTVRAAEWTVVADQMAAPSADTSWPPEAIRTIQIIGVDGHVLLERDP